MPIFWNSIRIIFPIVASLIVVFISITFSKTARNKYRILKSADGKKHIYFIIIFFLYMTAGIVHLCLASIPQISVSPAQINLGKGDRKQIGQLHITNNTNDFLYQILVKLILSSDSLSFGDHDIEIRRLPHELRTSIDFPIGSETSVEISNHVFYAEGIDSKGRQALFLFLDHLPPHRSSSFKVKNNTRRNISESDHMLYCSFYSVSDEPMEISTEDRQAEVVMPPLKEPFTPRRFTVLFDAKTNKSRP